MSCCDRINLFYGHDWTALPLYASSRERFHADLLITCTDSALFRAAVGATHRDVSARILWIDCGNSRASARCVIGHAGRVDEKVVPLRLPNVFDLWPELATMEAADREEPSCSVAEVVTRQEWPLNRAVASEATTLLCNLFRKGKLTHHGAFIDTDRPASRDMAIDADAWAFYGYAAPRAPSQAQRRRKDHCGTNPGRA